MKLIKFCLTDMIATLGETTGRRALRTIRDKMEADPTGQRILM